MNNKVFITISLYILGLFIVLNFIKTSMPIIFISAISVFYLYSKKRPNKKRKTYVLVAIIISLFGVAGCTSTTTSTKDKNQKTEVSKQTKLTEPSAKNKAIKAAQKKKEKELLKSAKQSLSLFEKEISRTTFDNATQAIRKIQNNNSKKVFLKRLQNAEQKLYIKEAENLIKQLETSHDKALIENATQKISFISDNITKESFEKRVSKVNNIIQDYESQLLAKNNAEEAVKNLENYQLRENISDAQNKVNNITDRETKEKYKTRIHAVVSAIDTREQQERETQLVAEQQQQFAQTPQPSTTSYANCTLMRQAGAAPISKGQPGYAPHLDRDNDGLACE
ncbi:calcium-binding protein [Streptococcus iniae]|uniref:excalibur calcium-binding domain-containing protein n=1 Tax=Streptococcus iniae TaxID=1346 RepID=UPI0008DB1823|nr:excalibur calcium-binding domain-containing protein [Streptococcus iniae]OHX26928.1 hypothetical protein BKX95_07910 [Streptococcus iniae]RLV27164.1 calcium-binding protein [Streptococcus iniae]